MIHKHSFSCGTQMLPRQSSEFQVMLLLNKSARIPMVSKSMNGVSHDKDNHEETKAKWNIIASMASLRSVNSIRTLLESMPTSEGRGKPPISLGLGDPSGFITLPQPAAKAIADALLSFNHNGYAPSSGVRECRRAVANYLSADLPFGLRADDIYMTPGCSQAINMSIAALAAAGRNMLVPKPGFPLYETFCNFYGVECRHYDLLPQAEWQVDISNLEAIADDNTIAIIICNPGNPCGSVYSYNHLEQIAAVAKKLRVPIISDEIYAKMTLNEREFVPMGTFAWDVPVLTVGGISKRWLAPGWRLGWLCVCDPNRILAKARVIEAITNVAHMSLATNTFVQAAVPKIIESTPNSFFRKMMEALEKGADLCYKRVANIPGLHCPSKPQGSIYIMVRIECSRFRDVKDDRVFAARLIEEEAVSVLPGAAFGYEGWMRILFAAPLSLLDEAWDRIQAFCQRRCINFS